MKDSNDALTECVILQETTPAGIIIEAHPCSKEEMLYVPSCLAKKDSMLSLEWFLETNSSPNTPKATK